MAEGVRIEAPRGRGMGRGCPPPQPRGSGENHKLPQRGPGRSPGWKRIWCILWRSGAFRLSLSTESNSKCEAAITAIEPISSLYVTFFRWPHAVFNRCECYFKPRSLLYTYGVLWWLLIGYRAAGRGSSIDGRQGWRPGVAGSSSSDRRMRGASFPRQTAHIDAVRSTVMYPGTPLAG